MCERIRNGMENKVDCECFGLSMKFLWYQLLLWFFEVDAIQKCNIAKKKMSFSKFAKNPKNQNKMVEFYLFFGCMDIFRYEGHILRNFNRLYCSYALLPLLSDPLYRMSLKLESQGSFFKNLYLETDEAEISSPSKKIEIFELYVLMLLSWIFSFCWVK